MTEYKKQHFIPQWYLRNFSPDWNRDNKNEHIWAYDISSKTIELKTIQETAQQEYFYDEEGEFEKSLMETEADTSKAVSVIIKNESIRELSGPTRKKISQFFLFQLTRTEASKAKTKNFVTNYLEDEIKPKLRTKYEKVPEILPFIEWLNLDANFFQYSIRMALADAEIISDLKLILLINSTKSPFITSDYPVVFNNYYYRAIGEHGLQTPGLQIICPITDRLCLMLIDIKLYKMTLNKQSKIEILEESDVNSINCLQILNCYKQGFSKQNNLEYVQKIHLESLQKKKNFGTPRFKRSYDDFTERNYQIRFSFLKNNPRSGEIIPQWKKISNDATLPFRNKDLCDQHRVQTDSVIALCMAEYRSQIENE
jgi:hypothetical protein